MRYKLLITSLILTQIACAQSDESLDYVNFINSEDIKEQIGVLASAEFEGREAGESGGQKAAIYIEGIFKSIGLHPVVDTPNGTSFFQKVPLRGNKSSNNILGLIKGSEFPDEVIIVSAHYDHLGKKGDEYYPGADDNASGVSALLEAAQAFAEANKNGNSPRRSILFIALTAEEKGLKGSEYYTDVNPIFPLTNTVVNLNMDMVGHLDDLHPKDPNFVSVVGSDWQSTELHVIHENANRKVGLELDYTFNAIDHPEMFFYRSDQYNFAKHGIPVIFYTSGDHHDYHKLTDVVDNIEFGRIKKVAELVYFTAWEIANRNEKIKVDKQLKKLR